MTNRKVLLCSADEAAIIGHAASLVLNQIRYWRDKANNGSNRYVVERSGFKWVAHSREQLCMETALSPKQLRLVIERLKKNGLIAVEQHLFHGKNVGHFRIENGGPLPQETQDGLTQGVQIKMATNDSPKKAEYGQPKLDKNDQLQTLETDLKTMKDCGAPNAPTPGYCFGKNKKVSKEKEKSSEDTSGSDLPSSAEVPAVELSVMFRNAWEEIYGGSFLPRFSNKEMGQFKNLAQSCPPGLASLIVKHCVTHWYEFCAYAQGKQGGFNLPSMPHLGTLLRFVQSAAQLYQDEQERTAKCEKKADDAKKRLAEIGAVTKVALPLPKEPEERMATLEEVAIAFGIKQA